MPTPSPRRTDASTPGSRLGAMTVGMPVWLSVKTSSLAPSLSRCRHHVDACLGHLRQAHAIVLNEGLPELLALELRLTLEQLGSMVGAVYTDDLLDRVFSRFCIGK